MAEVSWIKIKTNTFDDEKIKLLESMPEGDKLLIIWVRLLCLAGKTNLNGIIQISDSFGYSDEMLATITGKDIKIIRLAIDTLSKFEMIEVTENNKICILNWEKHQNIDGLDKVREQNKLRKQKQRKNQKALSKNVTRHVTVTNNHATEQEQEQEQEKEQEKEQEDKYINILNAMPPKNILISFFKENGLKEFSQTEAEKFILKYSKTKISNWQKLGNTWCKYFNPSDYEQKEETEKPSPKEIFNSISDEKAAELLKDLQTD